MKIVITGAAGLVGRALAGEYRAEDVVPLRHSDLDITDRDAVLRTISLLRPELIFNCSVIGVDECERNPTAAKAINAGGPAALAEAAEQCGAAIVHFSSNYVFDGAERKFYTIEDEPRPVNVYGETKAAGEREVVERCRRSYIIRTSWVFGPHKANFLSTATERLRKGERVAAIEDVWASTTYVIDLVKRVAEIIHRRQPGTYHVVDSGVCSYADFAREAARIVGADASLIDVATEASMSRAPRPRYTPMRCLLSERLGFEPMRPWQQALAKWSESVPPASGQASSPSG